MSIAVVVSTPLVQQRARFIFSSGDNLLNRYPALSLNKKTKQQSEINWEKKIFLSSLGQSVKTAI